MVCLDDPDTGSRAAAWHHVALMSIHQYYRTVHTVLLVAIMLRVRTCHQQMMKLRDNQEQHYGPP